MSAAGFIEHSSFFLLGSGPCKVWGIMESRLEDQLRADNSPGSWCEYLITPHYRGRVTTRCLLLASPEPTNPSSGSRSRGVFGSRLCRSHKPEGGTRQVDVGTQERSIAGNISCVIQQPRGELLLIWWFPEVLEHGRFKTRFLKNKLKSTVTNTNSRSACIANTPFQDVCWRRPRRASPELELWLMGMTVT